MPIKLAPVPDPIPDLKVLLTREIVEIIRYNHEAFAARWLRCDMARVSDIKHGRHARFSLEKLIRFVTYLDRRVDLKITYTGLQRNCIMRERLAGSREFSSYPPPPGIKFGERGAPLHPEPFARPPRSTKSAAEPVQFRQHGSSLDPQQVDT